MSLRAVFICAHLVAGAMWIFWLMAPGLGVVDYGWLWLAGVGGLMILSLLIHILISCPHCGNPMNRRRIEGLALIKHWYAPWPPRRCDECGCRLDEG